MTLPRRLEYELRHAAAHWIAVMWLWIEEQRARRGRDTKARRRRTAAEGEETP